MKNVTVRLYDSYRLIITIKNRSYIGTIGSWKIGTIASWKVFKSNRIPFRYATVKKLDLIANKVRKCKHKIATKDYGVEFTFAPCGMCGKETIKGKNQKHDVFCSEECLTIAQSEIVV